jgi:DNA-binding NtrC family response regulator
MTAAHVLIIDDEKELLKTLAERLGVRGITVETAESGEEALGIIENTDFDAVVLDLAMPGIDGLETLRRMHEIKPDLQVVLLTGHATVAASIEAMKLGAVDLLEKPADFQDLLTRIEQASEKTAVLFEKRTEQDISKILRERGW